LGRSSVLFSGLEQDEISETLRNVADNESMVRVSVVLLIVAGISTLILAAALYAITKHEDRNLAKSSRAPVAPWKPGSTPSGSRARLRCCGSATKPRVPAQTN
jgi:Domain of unknown function (DUF4386)